MTVREPPELYSSAKAWRRWHFGSCVLDERTHELFVNGVDVELERKPLEVLTYLVQHAGEVCTKDELLAAVWPARVLSETVLTKCVGRLREALSDEHQEIVKTSYGFGYRFVAPVRVETTTPTPVHVDVHPGMHPPSRPLWSLVERLGGGGHGEAWRARHDKTGEQRVFKFALEETALVALKREITLFRVLNETLEADPRVRKLLDWNLEQIPYFVEAEFIAGGSLVDWIAARGGISSISLPDRLEIVAKIADAVAAVHSVGVLHKDLKPTNVLIRPQPNDQIAIVLADFGSGGVLDFTRLEALGITRLGFTKTVSTPDMTSGTPLYLAPEVLAGQPFTVKSDIYALGIILYQFLAGDFHKGMSPGWERGIEDELLCQDIALMAEGNPAERVGDAESMARRLRTIEERRECLLAERREHARAQRAQRLVERAQARRLGLVLAFAALVAGLAASTALYVRATQAQQRAEIAATQAKAVTEFLSKDVFAPVSSPTEPVKNMTVVQLLQRAGDDIDRRFSNDVRLASELHFLIGRSFQAFYEAPLAVQHFRRSMELGRSLAGQDNLSALRSAAELVDIDYSLGDLAQTLPRYTQVLNASSSVLTTTDPTVLELRLRLAKGHYLLGEWTLAASAFESILADLDAHKLPALAGRADMYYGELLIDMAQPRPAQERLRSAVTLLTRALGGRHALVSESLAYLGRSFADSGEYAEAQRRLTEAQDLGTRWAPPDTWTSIRPRFFTALLELQQDEPAKAERILSDIVAYDDALSTAYYERHAGLPTEADSSAPARRALGDAYSREGKLDQAYASLQLALQLGELADGPQHPSVLSTRLALAELDLAQGNTRDASELQRSVPLAKLTMLPAAHPILAQWHRVNGLLALSRGDTAQARKSLETVARIDQALYGPNHWRTVRAKQELSLAGYAKVAS